MKIKTYKLLFSFNAEEIPFNSRVHRVHRSLQHSGVCTVTVHQSTMLSLHGSKRYRDRKGWYDQERCAFPNHSDPLSLRNSSRRSAFIVSCPVRIHL